MPMTAFSAEMKKGSMELLILSLLDTRPMHGYDIGRQIELRSAGHLRFALASVYPTLVRLEARGLIKGRWVEKPGERSRCCYRLTPDGLRALARQKLAWQGYTAAVNQVLGIDHA
ncbi:MAG: helix-turn-helix transcriptional regulator [Acidobacteriota bacterium]